MVDLSQPKWIEFKLILLFVIPISLSDKSAFIHPVRIYIISLSENYVPNLTFSSIILLNVLSVYSKIRKILKSSPHIFAEVSSFSTSINISKILTENFDQIIQFCLFSLLFSQQLQHIWKLFIILINVFLR